MRISCNSRARSTCGQDRPRTTCAIFYDYKAFIWLKHLIPASESNTSCVCLRSEFHECGWSAEPQAIRTASRAAGRIFKRTTTSSVRPNFERKSQLDGGESTVRFAANQSANITKFFLIFQMYFTSRKQSPWTLVRTGGHALLVFPTTEEGQV